MGVLKNDYDEVDEAMFQGVDGPWEIIFYISGNAKSDFHVVA
jgi:hypothetical protein